VEFFLQILIASLFYIKNKLVSFEFWPNWIGLLIASLFLSSLCYCSSFVLLLWFAPFLMSKIYQREQFWICSFYVKSPFRLSVPIYSVIRTKTDDFRKLELTLRTATWHLKLPDFICDMRASLNMSVLALFKSKTNLLAGAAKYWIQ